MKTNLSLENFNFNITKAQMFDNIVNKEDLSYYYNFQNYNNGDSYNNNTLNKLITIYEIERFKDSKVYQIENYELDGLYIIELKDKKSGLYSKIMIETDVDQALFNDPEYNDIVNEKLLEKYRYCNITVFAKNNGDMFYFVNMLLDDIGLTEFVEYKNHNSSFILSSYYSDHKKEIQQKNKRIEHNDIEKIDIDLYNTIDIDRMIKLFKQSEENLLVLNGEPGIGKTSLIKYYFSQLDDEALVSYTNDVNVLQSDEFWNTIEDSETDILIIDDIDNVIKKRDLSSKIEQQNSIVNKLLTLLDGIIRNDIKIIITSNLSKEKIDEALLRSGRCFSIITFETLDYSDALSIWTNKWKLDEKIFKDFFQDTNSKIKQSDLIQLKKDIFKEINKKSFMKKKKEY